MKYKVGQKVVFMGSIGTIVAFADVKKRSYKIEFDRMTAYLLEHQFEAHE